MENEALAQTESQLLSHSGKVRPIFQKYHKIEVIAALHLVLITYGLYLTFEDIFAQHYPLSFHEVAVVFFYYSFHYTLIGSLLIGHKKEKPLFYIPWMIVVHIVLTFVTYLWIKNIFKYGMFYDASSFFINLIVLGIGWLGWSLVSSEVISRYFIFRKNQQIPNNKNVKDT